MQDEDFMVLRLKSGKVESVTDRPIIFSGPMVRALLDGRKTMTRRLAWRTKTNQGGHIPDGGGGQMDYVEPHEVRVGPSSWQKTQPGDRLWVRESHQIAAEGVRPDWLADHVWYLADDGKRYFDPPHRYTGKCTHGLAWVPSIHMPRWASRLTLLVDAVKVERLQDISEEDAKAEGAIWHDGGRVGHSGWRHDPNDGYVHGDCGASFCRLWLNLHGAGSWDANPEVVAISFRVEARNIDQQPPATSTEDRGHTPAVDGASPKSGASHK